MAVNILSVDDELDLEFIINQFFASKIENGEYFFYFAHNGIEALEILEDHPEIEIVLSDINMPKMNGLTLLSKIKEKQISTLMCIMVSAYGDMRNICHAMNHGAFDFITKPFNLKDLEAAIEKAKNNIDFIRESQQNRRQLEHLRSELATASKIQHAILPNKIPQLPLEIYAQMTPAYEVGGDFYDFFQIDETHIGFVIADVSGKGIPASLLMAICRTMIRTVGMQGVSSEECISYINRLIFSDCPDNMFITVFYGIYDIESGNIDYTNAGHMPPFIIHSDYRVEKLKCEQNFMVGVVDRLSFKSNHCTLNPGDTLFLYTDGVTEAFNKIGQTYGEERLIRELPLLAHSETLEKGISKIYQTIQYFAADAPQSDDLTILAIKSR